MSDLSDYQGEMQDACGLYECSLLKINTSVIIIFIKVQFFIDMKNRSVS